MEWESGRIHTRESATGRRCKLDHLEGIVLGESTVGDFRRVIVRWDDGIKSSASLDRGLMIEGSDPNED